MSEKYKYRKYRIEKKNNQYTLKSDRLTTADGVKIVIRPMTFMHRIVLYEITANKDLGFDGVRDLLIKMDRGIIDHIDLLGELVRR